MKQITVALFALMILITSVHSEDFESKIDLSLAKEIDHSVKSGLKYLYEQQEDDGSWQHYPAITGLVLSAFLRAHPSITPDEPVIANGFDFLKSCLQPDGGIYLDDLPAYNTAICLVAFKDANHPDFLPIIINAEKFLMGIQLDDKYGFSTDSLYYGGVGYDSDNRPDLSNLQWAIESLAIDDIQGNNPEMNISDEEKERIQRKKLFYDKALTFLAKVQNLQAVNKEEYAANDGGFMYEPGSSKAGGTSSYGSMTYAGMKSLIYARLEKNDARVRAAFDWISSNFTVETTPLMKNQGLYYYYQTMAKSLNVYGQEIITDHQNRSRQWRYELANQLLRTQSAEGFWVNDNGRWWENNPVLVTAYSILALEEIAGLPHSTTIKKRRNSFLNFNN
jgi:squalene-hopene/tetraprenyl-beta-curcumene cyclase